MGDLMAEVRAAWGTPPDWVTRLAQECAASSQRRVAARIGRSSTLVNRVLKNKYDADLEAVADIVRGVFMDGQIQCPLLGAIPSNECHEWRAKSRNFGNANILRVQMYRACNHCPRNKKEGGDNDQ